MRDEGLRQAKGAEELAKQRLAEVVSCRAEITQLKDQRAELEMRVSTLEVAVDAGEQQLQVRRVRATCAGDVCERRVRVSSMASDGLGWPRVASDGLLWPPAGKSDGL